MQFMLSFVLLTGLAQISQGTLDKQQPPKAAVPVLQAQAVGSSAVKQVKNAPPKLGDEVPAPATSLNVGLRYAQKVANRPILAMAERDGWFFYATSVAQDEKTGAPMFMISGYAIQRDGGRVIRWSIW
jgi:hypothetical protein